MFHTKICGVRLPADIEVVADAGADAIGLNFFPASVRYVDPASETAVALARAARDRGLLCVGLFVNEAPATIDNACQRLALDAIQLHGDEDVADMELLAERTAIPIIRAIKLPTGSLSVKTIESAAYRWATTGCHLLFDADAGSAHGGAGRPLDWPAIGRWAAINPNTSWTLAGGLKPGNVANAIGESKANSVDVASGVEQPRGEKSEALIRQFVAESKKALF